MQNTPSSLNIVIDHYSLVSAISFHTVQYNSTAMLSGVVKIR